jgi:hypothetical protein
VRVGPLLIIVLHRSALGFLTAAAELRGDGAVESGLGTIASGLDFSDGILSALVCSYFLCRAALLAKSFIVAPANSFLGSL